MNNEEKKKDLNPVTGKEPLTEAERIKRKKMIVYAMMGIVFVLVMWLIFAPSNDGKTNLLGTKGFNTEMPDANSGDIISATRPRHTRQARWRTSSRHVNRLSAVWVNSTRLGTEASPLRVTSA